MIKSMTGFGRCEITEEHHKFTVELKSVNHRYLDVNVKIPKKLGFFENAVRTILKEYAQRGKVDIFITYEDDSERNISLRYNETVASQYLAYCKEMAEKFGLECDIRVSTLSRFPEVFVMEEQDIDEKELWTGLEQALRGAAEQFADTRVREGECLRADLNAKLQEMLSYVAYIEKRSPAIVAEYRQKIRERVHELLEDKQLDESRIATEVTLFADKICVDEEIVRLRSHVEAMKTALEAGGSIGRKLDFIAQEMNREANTILSKTTDLAISDVGIDLKTVIEKVREQIQNIE